ncbi:hypothetical protein [Mesorhizobium sp. L-2-11]|uniref:hypothetical protein n=1 Tax=Mesorhizobium sp. L-2-11 TaxID=2744521 RepID=UPI001925ECC4|nr:hypothetical protein [Mesorhizobium sp. L-2-11]BCH18857.1 hypothetical protein MesoLjLa_57080 [Mesorhizobium sp. L-2-11]
MTAKRCKIHYRKLRRDNSQFPTETLSAKIRQALNTKKGNSRIAESVKHRIADVPKAEGYQRFLNDFHETDEYVFGDICLFSPGEMQALLQLSADPAHPTLDEVMKAWAIAESKAPDGHEYLHGIAYWLAVGDHFYQIQHVTLQAKSMEEYLTWLLRDQAGVISAAQYVELQAEFDRDQVGGDLGDVKSVEIGGLVPETVRPALPAIATPQVVDVETHESLGEKIAAGWGKARKIIDDLLGPVEAEKLIESMPPDAALEVTVNIGYRATKRKFGKEFMGNLAAGLRNAPDGELRVRGRDGEIKGDDARLSADMTVRKMSDTSGLLDLEHALSQMLEVHRRFLHDGKIVS